MPFKFRDYTQATADFGLLIAEALKKSACQSTFSRTDLWQYFLFDNIESLEVFGRALRKACWRRHHAFNAQYEGLRWALDQSGSMLLIFHGDTLYIMCSEDPEEFDRLHARPRQRLRRLKNIVDNFHGASSRRTYGHLSVVRA